MYIKYSCVIEVHGWSLMIGAFFRAVVSVFVTKTTRVSEHYKDSPGILIVLFLLLVDLSYHSDQYLGRFRFGTIFLEDVRHVQN